MLESTSKPKGEATLRDVAARAGVTPQTVSVVLNGSRSGTRVSHATRQRIQEAALLLRYRPNAVARGLSQRRMNTLGVVGVYADPGINLYFLTILTGILRAGMRTQNSITVFSGQEWAEVEKTLSLTCDGRCDGLLLIGSPSGIVDTLRQNSISFVLINEPYSSTEVACIDVDNTAAAHSMVTYLLSLGHRRIAIFCGDSQRKSAQERLAGYIQAYEDAGVPHDTRFIYPGTYSKEAGEANALLLAQLPPKERPTAIFCSNDEIAIGALNTFLKLGIRVPDEIAVAGFDDIVTAELAHPPLTTVRQPLERIGERAVEMLLAQIEGRADFEYKEVIPTEIIARASTRPRTP
jgi:LacI family transcriptional regulator